MSLNILKLGALVALSLPWMAFAKFGPATTKAYVYKCQDTAADIQYDFTVYFNLQTKKIRAFTFKTSVPPGSDTLKHYDFRANFNIEDSDFRRDCRQSKSPQCQSAQLRITDGKYYIVNHKAAPGLWMVKNTLKFDTKTRSGFFMLEADGEYVLGSGPKKLTRTFHRCQFDGSFSY